MENSNDSGKIIGALLIGAAIGGVLGILFAPAKGTETRKKISGKTDEFTDAIKEKFEDFLSQMRNEVEPLKAKAKEYAAAANEKFEATKEKVKDFGKDGQ